jgi:hypothetical protein
MAYDPIRQVTVLFGGQTGTGASSVFPRDTWTWDGTRWELRATEGPAPRYVFAMAYDARRQKIVLYGGGRGGRPYDALNDVWEWDGTRWLEIKPHRPPGRP